MLAVQFFKKCVSTRGLFVFLSAKGYIDERSIEDKKIKRGGFGR